MNSALRILYMAGGEEYTILPLETLIKNGQKVLGVYTKPSARAGRGKKISDSPLKLFAKRNKIPVNAPKTFNNEELEKIAKMRPDYILVFSYGLILPKKLLSYPKYGCINIHTSLLPKWRGPAPVQYAIMNNEKVSGFTLMIMNDGIDTGDIILKKEINIENNDNTMSLTQKITKLSCIHLINTLEKFAKKEVKRVPQDEKNASYTKKLTKEDSYVNFDKSAIEVEAKIRALNPNPGAKCFIKGEVIKILNASIENPDITYNKYNSILDDNLLIACKTGAIRLLKIQRQGKKPLAAKEVLNGWKVEKGTYVNGK